MNSVLHRRLGAPRITTNLEFGSSTVRGAPDKPVATGMSGAQRASVTPNPTKLVLRRAPDLQV